ncbi:MAG: glycosyl hydrolase [Lachnospiraceae bacterium]
MEKKLSAATKRAIENGYFEGGNDWFTYFKFTKLKGDLAPEEGVVRRDPSSVILVDGVYYTYYTKSTGEWFGPDMTKPDQKAFPWDYAEVWYATSTDGYEWKEMGCAVGLGEKGQYDERSVFTPEILAHEGKYYLSYQCAMSPHIHRTRHCIGMSIAENPNGPFVRLEEPILRPADNGEWYGDDDNRFRVRAKGDFDSCQVHDPSIHYYKDKFYLYYKGETMGEEFYKGGREIRWGVAIADEVTGPYIKSEYNPITNSGHEPCLWEFDGGMAALVTSDGMEKNTIQYAKDGVNFEIMSSVGRWEGVPHAGGPFRSNPADHKEPLDGFRWGLSMIGAKFDYIVRFDLAEQNKIHSNNSHAEMREILAKEAEEAK